MKIKNIKQPFPIILREGLFVYMEMNMYRALDKCVRYSVTVGPFKTFF